MANNFDFTKAASIMKEIYTPDVVTSAVLKDRPLLALAKKNTKFTGSDVKQPILFGNPQNRSATFATALAGTSTSSLAAFTVTTVNNYSLENIDNRTIQSTKDDEGAFTSAIKLATDGAINSLANSMAIQLYRGGWGAMGKIGSITGSVVTLSVPTDARMFEKGMAVVFSSSLNAAALNSTTPVSITAVDTNLGKITLSATTGSPANGNYIFCDGDRQNSSTPTRLCWSGLDAWVPYGGVSAGDSFFGVDRTVDTRLSGNYLDGTAMNVEDAILGGIELAVAQSGKPDFVMVNPSQYLNLVRILGSKIQYVNVGGDDASFGFRGVNVQGPAGEVVVMSDVFCPGDRAFVIESDSLLIHSVGELQSIFETDGTPYLRSASNDGVDLRVVSYSQPRILAPSHFATVALSL